MTASDTTESSRHPAAPPDLVAGLADTLDTLIDQPLVSRALFDSAPPMIDRYVIEQRMGAGATSVVYAARDSTLDRLVALKVMAGRDADGVWRGRVLREARALASLPHHPNVVAVYDVGEWRGHPFIAMELVAGVTLARWQIAGPRTWPAILRHYLAAGRGLEAAHAAGLVHRDFKPANVLVADPGRRVAVTDFGLAAPAAPRAELAAGNARVGGTPAYLAPEQRAGTPPRPSADVYSFSVALCEALVGWHPSLAPAPRGRRALSESGVPRCARAAIERGMTGDPAQRWPCMAPLLAAIEAALSSSPTWSSRATGMMVVLAVGLTGDLALARWSEAHQVAPPTTLAPPFPEQPLDYKAIDKEARTTLLASLVDSDATVRVQGVDALSKIKDRSSEWVLTERLEKDSDDEVRAHAAAALGAIGAWKVKPLLATREATALRSHKVWYAGALARLGDEPARRRLFDYMRDDDIEIAFKAGMILAEVSMPGERKAVEGLQRLVSRDLAPDARASILTRLVALHDPNARNTLYDLCHHRHEGTRLAAARGLARLGDAECQKVLQEVGASRESPNRLSAAVALISLGMDGGMDGGFDQSVAALDYEDPGTRQLVARALGERGEHTRLPALRELMRDPDWKVRIAAAEAIVAIVGRAPQVLARQAIDWEKSALESQHWAVHQAIANVLADVRGARPAAEP